LNQEGKQMTTTILGKCSFLAVATLAVMLSGCFGGGAEVMQSTTTVSKGKELTDLRRALDEGAINPQEYERLRQKIMRRPDWTGRHSA
jgi:hypothetical protein